MTNQNQAETMINNVKDAFAPVSETFAKLQNMEVPEAARDFVKRAAGTAKDRAADIHAGSEKVTSALESAATGTVSELAKVSRNIQQAMFADTEAFYNGIDKLASAKSLSEAFQIQTDLLRAHGEVLVGRAKATSEYIGGLVADGARTAQDNLSKVYAKSA